MKKTLLSFSAIALALASFATDSESSGNDATAGNKGYEFQYKVSENA